jgi:hypothetical protein
MWLINSPAEHITYLKVDLAQFYYPQKGRKVKNRPILTTKNTALQMIRVTGLYQTEIYEQ